MSLGDLYFRPKAFELDGRLYEGMGVRPFKRLVVAIGQRVRKPRDRPNNYFVWDRSRSGLQAFERRTRRNELMHLAGVIIPATGLVLMASQQNPDPVGAVCMALIFAVNFHPLILQRYHRIRICGLLGRMPRREAPGSGSAGPGSSGPGSL